MHFAFAARTLRLGTDQRILQTLVVALAMVMRHEFSGEMMDYVKTKKITAQYDLEDFWRDLKMVTGR